MKNSAFLGHSEGALVFDRNFSSLILRWSRDATPHGVPPDHTYTRPPTRVYVHAGTRMSMSRASASVTGTLDTHAQAGTRTRGSSNYAAPRMTTSHTSVDLIENTIENPVIPRDMKDRLYHKQP